MVKSNKSQIQQVKDRFYWKDGKPCLSSYGVFNRGLTREEVQDYLRARAGRMIINKVEAAFWDLGCGSTGAVERLEGKEYFLTYRHDVEHWADVIFDKAVFVMD